MKMSENSKDICTFPNARQWRRICNSVAQQSFFQRKENKSETQTEMNNYCVKGILWKTVFIDDNKMKNHLEYT